MPPRLDSFQRVGIDVHGILAGRVGEVALMGALVGLGVGVGLLLVWSAFTMPRTPRDVARHRDGWLARRLGEAGLSQVSAPGAGAAEPRARRRARRWSIQVVSGTPPVALAFGADGGLPAVRGGRRPGPAPAARVRRGLARGRRQPRLGRARRACRCPTRWPRSACAGPEPLRPAFDAFALDYQVTGRFGDCLDRLKDELADPVGDRVVEGLRIAREVGGGELGRLLRNLSGYLRDDARTRSEMESRQAWTVNGARLAVAAPWLVLLLMSFQSDVIRRYASPAGVVILVVGAALCVVAYR